MADDTGTKWNYAVGMDGGSRAGAGHSGRHHRIGDAGGAGEARINSRSDALKRWRGTVSLEYIVLLVLIVGILGAVLLGIGQAVWNHLQAVNVTIGS
jgi:hypothetical protein